MKKQVIDKLSELIEEARLEHFVTPENHIGQQTNLEVLGALVANYCRWDYGNIEAVVRESLIDSNLKRMSVEA